MGIFIRSSSFFFSKISFRERFQAPKLRGSIKKKSGAPLSLHVSLTPPRFSGSDLRKLIPQYFLKLNAREVSASKQSTAFHSVSYSEGSCWTIWRRSITSVLSVSRHASMFPISSTRPIHTKGSSSPCRFERSQLFKARDLAEQALAAQTTRLQLSSSRCSATLTQMSYLMERVSNYFHQYRPHAWRLSSVTCGGSP